MPTRKITDNKWPDGDARIASVAETVQLDGHTFEITDTQINVTKTVQEDPPFGRIDAGSGD